MVDIAFYIKSLDKKSLLFKFLEKSGNSQELENGIRMVTLS